MDFDVPADLDRRSHLFIVLLGKGESVWVFGRAGGSVIAIDTDGMCPFLCQAIGEAGSPSVSPVLGFAE